MSQPDDSCYCSGGICGLPCPHSHPDPSPCHSGKTNAKDSVGEREQLLLVGVFGKLEGDHKVQQGQRVCGGKFQQKKVALVILAYVSCKEKMAFPRTKRTKVCEERSIFQLTQLTFTQDSRGASD